jgi:hypothetical protein
MACSFQSEAEMAVAKKKTTVASSKEDKVEQQPINVRPLNLETIKLSITGVGPYVSNRFGQKAQADMQAGMEAGDTEKKGKKRPPKDFKVGYEESLYTSTEGWYGINAAAFRNAAIDACRTVGYKMNYAKLALWVEPDGWGSDLTPLVQINGDPEMIISTVSNANGSTDLRSRGMFKKWSADVTMTFDADMFTREDVVNLMNRVGLQVGVGAGRPYSKKSAGMGWGRFTIGPKVEVLTPGNKNKAA